MSSDDDQETRIERAVAEACLARGIDEGYGFYVKDLVHRPTASWPACCGGGCHPCMGDVCAAAKDALKRLESDDEDA